MNKRKLIRITTVPISLEKLLEGQLEFMQQYYQVTAISADEEKLKKLGNRLGVPTYHVEMSRQITPIKDLAAAYKLYKFLKKEKPAIVHSHTPKAGIVGMLAGYFAKVPIRLHTVAGLPLMETAGAKRSVLNFVEKLTYRLATKVYPNSKGLYDFILAEKFTTGKKLKIIGNGSSNGIDTTYFNPTLFTESEKITLREKYLIPSNAYVFIFVGRLVGDKGINELVAAFSKLNSIQKESRLLLIGPVETELDALLESTLQEIDRNKHIIALGFQQDVRPFFAISNALVFPSYREGFPNVVMQAGAMGLSAIVSNINGCNEIVEEGKNGLIVAVKDTDALFAAMSNLLTDAPLGRQLSATAREHICKNYERKEVWQQLLKEYQSLK
ncbi:glycosyltransferase involved in cell wall biosynthesis [Pedobacter sp. UYEF25]